MNCWEFMKCGRDANGVKVKELGLCVAYPNHGTHCARIAGTLCGGCVQGSFAMKLSTCLQCDFYKSQNYDRTFPEKGATPSSGGSAGDDVKETEVVKQK
jgi:hypothetical protein